jgi:hypothetical protein
MLEVRWLRIRQMASSSSRSMTDVCCKTLSGHGHPATAFTVHSGIFRNHGVGRNMPSCDQLIYDQWHEMRQRRVVNVVAFFDTRDIVEFWNRVEPQS